MCAHALWQPQVNLEYYSQESSILDFLFSFSFFFWQLFGGGTHITDVYGGQRIISKELVLPATQVSGDKLRSSDLAASLCILRALSLALTLFS